MLEGGSENGTDGPFLVPVSVGGCRLFVAAQGIDDRSVDTDVEVEIAARKPRLDQVVDGLVAVAKEMAERFGTTDASKVSVQFGCDVAVETGTLAAVIGKASVQSAFTVTLEWTKQGT